MKTVYHPYSDMSKDVPDDQAKAWLDAGWLGEPRDTPESDAESDADEPGATAAPRSTRRKEAK